MGKAVGMKLNKGVLETLGRSGVLSCALPQEKESFPPFLEENQPCSGIMKVEILMTVPREMAAWPD